MHSTINVHLTIFLAMIQFLGICFAMSLPVLLLPEQILCQSPQRSTNTFKTAYNNALSAKNLRAMKTALDSIIAYDGDDADARRQRLVLSWELGEWTHLDEDYTALIMRDSSNGEAWERRGVVRWYGGKVQSACEDMRHASRYSQRFQHFTQTLCDSVFSTSAVIRTTSRTASRITMSALDSAILQEINLMRSNPKNYIPIAEEEFIHNAPILAPREGMMVLRELVQTLINSPNLTPLQTALPLRLAAFDHAEDLAAHTQYGHRGTDGSLPHTRLERYTFYRKMLGENIGYGIKSARTLVVGLLLDDGVQGRGHRGNLLNPRNRSIGIATAEHPMYPCVCVQMFEEALYPHP
ncbi:MAG: CAP domain-containing protein [Candidatus Kapabacteria bacterium]|nr:CAP domain-containing protein [Candidatus Kapabacteria bacterium]